MNRNHYAIVASLTGQARQEYIQLCDMINDARNGEQIAFAARELNDPKTASLLGQAAVEELLRQASLAAASQ